MSAPPLVVITTRLPPQVCGIGTYSWLLHRHWPNDSEGLLLVIDGGSESSRELDLSCVSEFGSDPSRLEALLDRVGAADLLLHYAGRAYHRYGCPFWLPRVLRKWKAKYEKARLVVFFHELPGENFPITSRFFWIDKCNARIIRQLAELTNAVATNTAEHARVLRKLADRTDAAIVPVGSNIEPVGDFPASQKQPDEFAIFGLPFGRWQTLHLLHDQIANWQRNDRLNKLHFIGPADDKFDRRSDDLINALPRSEAVIRHGLMPGCELSRLLGRVGVGLTNATVENWSKSTTFMAYAAHGCAIVGNVRSEDVPLRFVLTPEQLLERSSAEIATGGEMLQHWYRDNADWNSIAARIAGLFSGRSEKVLR
jgi:hypothetical protein